MFPIRKALLEGQLAALLWIAENLAEKMKHPVPGLDYEPETREELEQWTSQTVGELTVLSQNSETLANVLAQLL